MTITAARGPMHDYYDRRAPEYDEFWTGGGEFAALGEERIEEVELLIELLGALEPCRTLDVACGTGWLSARLPGDVVGLDASPAMVERAQQRLGEGGAILGEALALPFDDDSFGRAVASHFYGHLPLWDRGRFLREARRVAGELVMVEAAVRDDRPEVGWQERWLRDGSRHSIFKRYFRGPDLAGELDGADLLHAGAWFVVVRKRMEAR